MPLLRKIILLLFVFAISNMVSAKGKTLKITKNGNTDYAIVVPENANQIERDAAQLMQSYVSKVSGCKLDVVNDKEKAVKTEISIGLTNRIDPKISWQVRAIKPDGFRIFTEGKKLFVVGGSHKGVYYGVVDLLEKQLGCRMYAPDVEFVPEIKNITFPQLNYANEPANTLRIVHGQFNENAAYKEWMRLDNINEVFAYGYYVHTFNRLVPWESYFGAHPEYYAFMNGKHIIDQLCMTNPDVRNLVIDKLSGEMAKQPDKNIWSVSQNDNFSYCQCDKCREINEAEGAPSGALIHFVNQVAARFPDKTISTLAYQFSRSAPKLTKPAANVQMMLCTIELNRSKSIESDAGSQSFVKDIADWGKLTDNIYLWDYTVDFANSLTPFPNLHVLQPNIQFLTRKGAYQHFQQTNTMKKHTKYRCIKRTITLRK
jgi:hypothetical protein